MITELSAVGTMQVCSQAEAIALEQAVRRHVFAWFDTLDIFDRPNLTHPRLHGLEQVVRDAEYQQDWPGVEVGWQRWLDAIRRMAA